MGNRILGLLYVSVSIALAVIYLFFRIAVGHQFRLTQIEDLTFLVFLLVSVILPFFLLGSRKVLKKNSLLIISVFVVLLITHALIMLAFISDLYTDEDGIQHVISFVLLTFLLLCDIYFSIHYIYKYKKVARFY